MMPDKQIMVDLILNEGFGHSHLKLAAQRISDTELLLLDVTEKFYVAEIYIDGHPYKATVVKQIGSNLEVKLAPLRASNAKT
jgi:hypothetical protein